MRHLITVVAVSFAAALFAVPASPALHPVASVSSADCYSCLPGVVAAPPPPVNAEVPPVGGSDGFTCGDDCDFVDGPGTGPIPGVWTPCPDLDGATVCGDSGDGETGVCQRWCVVYAPNDPAPPDDAPAADPAADPYAGVTVCDASVYDPSCGWWEAISR